MKKPLVREYRPTPLDPPLSVPFPQYADHRVLSVHARHIGASPRRIVLTVNHWTTRFYVAITATPEGDPQ